MTTPKTVISTGGLSMLKSILDTRHRRVLIITDQNIAQHHLETLKQLIPHAATVILKPGETQKNFSTLGHLYQACGQASIMRHDLIVGLGGGVVCDLAGICASTWMRGCGLALIPTSLLAMVDAAIGGKTAIDFEGQKNAIGSFYDAEVILCDPELLATLPMRELRNGVAEIIKIGALFDKALLDALLQIPPTLDIDAEQWLPLIKRAVELKMSVVEKDPYDQTGHRAFLNYGHTLGHAIEAWSLHQKDPVLSHGESIGLGMTLIDDDPMNLLERFGLPVDLPDSLQPNDLIRYILADKKREQSTIIYIKLSELCEPMMYQVDVTDLPIWLFKLFTRHRERREFQLGQTLETTELL